MKRVTAFLLTAVIALGVLIFAHTAVTASQDDFLIYPTHETGDPSLLAGKTVDISFLCGEYLCWDASYTFGGETTADFGFDPEGWYTRSDYRAELEVYLSGGFGSSTSGGSFSIGSGEYGALLRAAAAGVGDNETQTTNLRMADYVNHYLPDFDLAFNNGTLYCDQKMSLHGHLTGESWYESEEAYDAFFANFRFPVQPDHIMSITVGKNELRQIVSLELEPQNGPELHFISEVNENGIWFVPIFRDEQGVPLPYESPAGHGIYFAPWKTTGQTYYGQDIRTNVVPDMDALTLLLPLAESLQILDMEIDPEAGTAWMLALEDGLYTVTRLELATGQAQKAAALPVDPAYGDTYARFIRSDGYLLVTAQERLALVEEATVTTLLTAPDAIGQSHWASHFNPDGGCLRFDGEQLYLTATTYHYDGAFWAGVWRQGELAYYGEYDCTLLRGNDDWYYATISADGSSTTLR